MSIGLFPKILHRLLGRIACTDSLRPIGTDKVAWSVRMRVAKTSKPIEIPLGTDSCGPRKP